MKSKTEKQQTAAHTPGPWQYDIAEGGLKPGVHEQAVVIGPDGFTLALTTANDARLIAAAPELLRVLIALHDRLITEAAQVPDDNDFLALERASMAVIAAAQGTED